jgi:serine/threonine protein kinase
MFGEYRGFIDEFGDTDLYCERFGYTQVRDMKKPVWTEAHALPFIQLMLTGIQQIHGTGIIHGSISLKKFVFVPDADHPDQAQPWQLRIVGFAKARWESDPPIHYRFSSPPADYEFSAPELRSTPPKLPTFASDIYSLGVCCAYLLGGWDAPEFVQIEGYPVSPELVALITRMTDDLSEMRCSLQEAINDPLFGRLPALDWPESPSLTPDTPEFE